jgi:hypothetical protein
MKEILAEPEETLKYRATERYAQSWTDPRMNVPTAGGGGGSGGVYQSNLLHTQTVTTENQKFGIGWILRKLKTK